MPANLKDNFLYINPNINISALETRVNEELSTTEEYEHESESGSDNKGYTAQQVNLEKILLELGDFLEKVSKVTRAPAYIHKHAHECRFHAYI